MAKIVIFELVTEFLGHYLGASYLASWIRWLKKASMPNFRFQVSLEVS